MKQKIDVEKFKKYIRECYFDTNDNEDTLILSFKELENAVEKFIPKEIEANKIIRLCPLCENKYVESVDENKLEKEIIDLKRCIECDLRIINKQAKEIERLKAELIDILESYYECGNVHRKMYAVCKKMNHPTNVYSNKSCYCGEVKK